MITLDDSLLIGRNQTRDVYLHPNHPDRVLKIEARELPGRERWYERPPKIESSLSRELYGYANVLVRLGRHHPFIARIYGLEETDLGPAIMAEHVSFGADRAGLLGRVINDPIPSEFTRDEIAWARTAYKELGDLLCEKKAFTHGIRAENLMLADKDGALALRMFDFKTIVYRQLISPRLVPGAEAYEFRRKMAEVDVRFQKALDMLDAVAA